MNGLCAGAAFGLVVAGARLGLALGVETGLFTLASFIACCHTLGGLTPMPVSSNVGGVNGVAELDFGTEVTPIFSVLADTVLTGV